MLNKLHEWLVAHPGIERVLEGLVFAVLAADYQYLKDGLASGDALTLVGLGNATLLAFKIYVNHVIKTNQGKILAWAQDSLETGSTPVSSGSGAPKMMKVGVPPPRTAALRLVKGLVIAFGVMALFSTSTASAWQVSGDAFSTTKLMSARVGMAVPSVAETDLVLMPSVGIGLDPWSSKPTYGASVCYTLLLAKVSPVSQTDVALTPWLGLGAGLYFDAAGPVESLGREPLIVKGTVNAVGPELAGIAPTVMAVYDFQTGEWQGLVSAQFPLEDIFSGDAITKVLTLW